MRTQLYQKIEKKIFDLLTINGYTRKYTDISKADDWYILNI